MKNNIYQLNFKDRFAKIIIQFFFFISIQHAQEKQYQDFIFSVLPFQIIKSELVTNGSQQMIIVESKNLILLNYGEKGIGIFCELTNKLSFKEFGQSVEYITVFGDDIYFLVALQNHLQIYLFNNINNEIYLILKHVIDISQINVSKILKLPKQKKMIVIGLEGEIIIYKYKENGNLLIEKSFQIERLISKSAIISQDEQYIFAGSNTICVQVFKIQTIMIDNQAIFNKLVQIIELYTIYEINFILLIEEQNVFVYYTDYWLGLYYVELQNLNSYSEDSIEYLTTNFINLGTDSITIITNCMIVSKEKRYLFIGIRSQGVLIYDIKEKRTPQLYFQIFVDAQVYDLMLSDNEDILYFSNSNGLYKYKKMLTQIDSQSRHLFNHHKSRNLLEGGSFYKWRCQITSNQILYGSFDTDQFQRFRINNHDEIQESFRLEQLDILPYQNDINQLNLAYINTVTIDKYEENLVVPIYNEKYVAVKYSLPKDNKDLLSPLTVKQFLQVGDPKYAETARISQDNKYIVFSYQNSILLIDNENFEVIVQFYIPEFILNCNSADFTKDTSYIFATARNIGIGIISIENINQPKIVEIIKTKGGETVKPSKIYNIMYILDGQNGLIIFDSSSLPIIKILSKFKLQGWANDVTLLNSENYAIISTMDRGMIWMINIQDKTSPYLLSNYQINQQNSYSTCIDPFMKYILILNSSSIRYLPLISSSIIYFECSIKNHDEIDYSRRIIGENEYLQVGYTYEIRMISLYMKKNQYIKKIYLYQNYKRLDLPDWIKYLSDSYIEMVIPKESLLQSKNNFEKIFNIPFSKITLIVKTAFTVLEDSFIFTIGSIKTSTELSKRIYLFLKSNSFLDTQNFLTDYFNPEFPIDFHDFQDEIQDSNQQQEFLEFTRDILQNSIDYTSVSWKVKSSLTLSYNNMTNSYFINTESNNVNIQLQFNSSQNLVFIDQKFHNVELQRYQQDTILNIESTKENINAILSSKIIYFCFKQTDLYQKYYISIILADGLNDDVNLVFNVNDLPFLSLKQEIQIKNRLQAQIEQISSDYNFSIDNYLLIEFDSNSFFDPDNIQLTYSLQIYQNENYNQIPLFYFLKFDSENLRLAGTPTSDNLFQYIKFRLIVSNGYNQTYDDFQIKINKISLTYILNMLIKTLGPLAFFLGVYRKRSYFINAIWKRKTFFSQETAFVDSIYRKKITILGDELVIAQLFFSKFCIKIQQKYCLNINKNQVEQFPITDSFNQNDKEDNFENRRKINTINQSQNPFQLSQKNVSFEDSIENISISKLSQSKIIRNSSMSKSFHKNLSQRLQNRINSQTQLYIKPILTKTKTLFPYQNDYNLPNNFSINNVPTSPLSGQIPYKLNEQEEKIANITRKSLHDARKRKNIEHDNIYNLSFLNTQQIEENSQNQKKISIGAIFNQMVIEGIEVEFKNKKIKISNYIKEYQNIHSRFHFSIHACVTNYLLHLDICTHIVYKYIKEYAQKSQKHNINDWYKDYVIIEATNELDCNGFPIPFSKIHIQEQNLIQCFSHLQIYNGKNSFFNDLQDYGVNPYLLKDALICDSLGLLTRSQSIRYMNYAHGESIHLQQQDIFSVEAFKLKEHSRMICLRKIFNLEYQRMPISKYQSLPSWIEYDCKNGVIMLEGLPTQSDIEDIQIRVYNRQNCVVKQFFLKVSDENIDKLNYVNKQITQSQENSIQSPKKLNNPFPNNDNNTNQSDKSSILKKQNIINQQKKKDFTFNKIPTKLSDQNQIDSEQQQILPSFPNQIQKQFSSEIDQSQNQKFSLYLLQKLRRKSKNGSPISYDFEQDGQTEKNKKNVQTRQISKTLSNKSMSNQDSPIYLNTSFRSHVKYFKHNSLIGEDNHNLPKLSNLNGQINNPFNKKN